MCYPNVACSCMTRWETPEVPCSCYGCPGCMFAYKSRCKYAGCCRPREFRHLRACGQPHAASLQVAGPHVRVSVSCKLLVRLYGFHGRVGSHTRLFCKLLVRVYRASRCGQPPAASCKLLVVLACLASCWSECPVSAGLASCRSACTGSRGRVGSHTRLLCKL